MTFDDLLSRFDAVRSVDPLGLPVASTV